VALHGGGQGPWYATRLFGMLAYWALALSVAYGLAALEQAARRHRPPCGVAHTASGPGGDRARPVTCARRGPLTRSHHAVHPLRRCSSRSRGRTDPSGVGVGQIAFYVSAAVYFSFNVRRRIGQRAWRTLHYATFLAYLGATAHGLMSGTDNVGTVGLLELRRLRAGDRLPVRLSHLGFAGRALAPARAPGPTPAPHWR